MKYLLTGGLLVLFVTVAPAVLGKPEPQQVHAQIAVQKTSEIKPVQAPQKVEADKTPAEPVKPKPEPPTPAVAPTPPPAPVGTCQSEIAKYGWDQRTALAVSYAESRYNPNIVNNNPRTGDYSIGCFQINIYGGNARTRPSEAQLKNPAVNVAWAWKLYTGNGNSFIGQWGVCRTAVRCY